MYDKHPKKHQHRDVSDKRMHRETSMKLKILFLSIIFLKTDIYGQNYQWPYGRIHCFGDSHCAHFFTNCKTFQEYVSLKIESKTHPRDPEYQYEKSIYCFHTEKGNWGIPFGIHWLGPRTMHRVGRDGIDIYSYDVQPIDILVFVFGEIDVRVHVGKQIHIKNRQLDEVIETLAKNYVAAIHKNQERYHCKCVILAITSPMHPHHTLEANDNLYIASAPLAERVLYAKKLNQKLFIECQKNGILFLDLPDIFTNPNGTLNLLYADTGEHIHPKFNFLVKDRLISQFLGTDI